MKTPKNETGSFASERARVLAREAEEWSTQHIVAALPEDIPTIDISDWRRRGGEPDSALVDQLRDACEQAGFYSLVGHGFSKTLRDEMFEFTKRFHALPLDIKAEIQMDQPRNPGGIGYLALMNRKLPARANGNENEAFLVKRDIGLALEGNLYPLESSLPGFRHAVAQYANALEALGKRLLPLYAASLDMPADFFASAFTHPLYRLRLSHYPLQSDTGASIYGIAPHVDTTFFTILAQSEPGLAVYSERRQGWISAPLVDDGFIINTGELLKQWSNDRFVSVKHFANNSGAAGSRYSIPFFFNANSDFPMACIPSCTGPDNPSKYPTVSYAQSQGVAQGE